MQETLVPSLGQEDPLKKETATHCRVLAWEILWREKPGYRHNLLSEQQQTEPGGLQSLGHKESDITERTRRGLKALPCHWRLCGFRALRRPVWLTLLLGAQCQPPPLFLFSFGSLGRCQPPATTPGHTAAPSSFSLFFKLIFIGV